jgi:hypothetical protein|uniref:Uncharacterized protein n=1 Tax=viral metagenome TaxID=1070528 RepID=A0A6C0HFZ4_9ZZZZ
MSIVVKTQDERLKESIRILSKLKELGVHVTDHSYKEISGRFNDWIKTGEEWSGTIEFPKYRRTANIHLPVKQGKYAKCDFLVWKD